MKRLDPSEYPANCFYHIAAINKELDNIASLEKQQQRHSLKEMECRKEA